MEKDSTLTVCVVMLTGTGGEASLFLYDVNYIQTPTHNVKSAKTRQPARGNTQTPPLVYPKTTTSDVSCPK